MQIYFRLKSVFFFRPKYLEKWKILLYYDNILPDPTTPLVLIGLAWNCSFPGSRKNYIV